MVEASVIKKILRELALKLLRMTCVSVLLFSVAGYCGLLHRYLELTSHFRVQYLFIAIACAVSFFLFRARRWLIVSAFVVLLNAAVVAPWYLPTQAADPQSRSLRVLLANVLYSNRNYDAVLNLVRQEDPDVIVLQEAIPRWQRAMKPLTVSHPFTRITPDGTDNFIACYSRFPIEDAAVSASAVHATFGLVAKLKVHGREVSFISIHPPVPVTALEFPERNAQLAATAIVARELHAPKILIGDLNNTLWSPYFSNFVRESGLKVARRGFGVLPTWPTFLPPLMIPIDHCLVSDDIQVVDCRTGSKIGSDHLPLIVDLALPNENQTSP
ncbi:MAG TPA: endonuclease/exonuclease/phosphatase family protein [Blastocatellia bacterium]|nr:endonuclease/exonuclease/phosphatase family protein [Blastocatellia bacterium]